MWIEADCGRTDGPTGVAPIWNFKCVEIVAAVAAAAAIGGDTVRWIE